MPSPELRKLALVSSLRAAPIFSGLPDEDVDRIADYAVVTAFESLRLRDAETRFLHWLLRQVPKATGEAQVALGMTKGLLASELGIRQETFSRILAKLRDDGLLEVHGQLLVVLDTEALRAVFEKSVSSGRDSA